MRMGSQPWKNVHVPRLLKCLIIYTSLTKETLGQFSEVPSHTSVRGILQFMPQPAWDQRGGLRGQPRAALPAGCLVPPPLLVLHGPLERPHRSKSDHSTCRCKTFYGSTFSVGCSKFPSFAPELFTFWPLPAPPASFLPTVPPLATLDLCAVWGKPCSHVPPVLSTCSCLLSNPQPPTTVALIF